MARFAQDSETETAIFHAAMTVFARKGKDGARMQEIADEAGINKALLHYYYRSKDGLYEAVFTQVIAHFMSTVERQLDDDQPFADVLRNIIDAYVDEHRAHPEVARMWMHENLNGAPVARAFLQAQMDRGRETTLARIVRRIRKAVADGEINDVDPVHTFISILGASVFFFLGVPTFSVLRPEIAENPDAVAGERKTHIFDLIYHGLEPR
ncbi:MAG: TetR family transcriptional regulator [Rhodothermales bacterium]|nr:TetR family transcriptional regulator [Rhodothermales bacterium]